MILLHHEQLHLLQHCKASELPSWKNISPIFQKKKRKKEHISREATYQSLRSQTNVRYDGTSCKGREFIFRMNTSLSHFSQVTTNTWLQIEDCIWTQHDVWILLILLWCYQLILQAIRYGCAEMKTKEIHLLHKNNDVRTLK